MYIYTHTIATSTTPAEGPPLSPWGPGPPAEGAWAPGTVRATVAAATVRPGAARRGA